MSTPTRSSDVPSGGGELPAERWILHVDMDAFFAAVEVLDRPELRGKPVIVGGTPEGHGVVSTASYEAREFGVHSAMPAAEAVRLCPRGIFLRPRPGRYAAVAREIFRIFEKYTPLVEPVSIDEAFLDVTGAHPLRAPEAAAPAEAIAREIQRSVREETGGLECSIGVAPSLFLAKIASDLAKPAGIRVVPRGGVAQFLAPLPLRKIWGVGPRTEERLQSLGFRCVRDLQSVSPDDLEKILGSVAGRHLARLCRGIDERRVEPSGEAKSVSQETTFAEFIPCGDIDRIEETLFSLSDGVGQRLRREELLGRTVTLKVRDDRFRTWTRARSLEAATSMVDEIFAAARSLFREKIDLEGRRVRLLGVGVSGLTREAWRQLDLLEGERWRKSIRLEEAADAIREKLGEESIVRGRLVKPPGPRRRKQ